MSREASVPRKARAGRGLILLGLVIGLPFPLGFGLGMGLWEFLPNCQVGTAVGPTTGCALFGVDINGLMDILVGTCFLGAVVLAPIGALLVISGLVRRSPRRLGSDGGNEGRG
jgi:hypothetical protein